jgi:hypothetical protein
MAILQIEPNAANANATFTFSGTTVTTDLQIPYGNIAQRPANPNTGSLRYNTESASVEVYDGTDWASTGGGSAIAAIANVVPGTFNGEQGTQFTINGTNFTGDAVVKFVDSSDTEFTAFTVTFVSSRQLLATTPQDFTVAQGPLSVREIQSSGTITKLNCIDTGGSPSWVTPAGQIGGDIYRNGSVSVTVTATDPDTSATIAYSVLSGALPVGLSLNPSTGVISGTAPNVGSDTTYNFTLRATDNAGNMSDRAFSMVILQGAPGAPTIGTATRSASQSVQITFTAPANIGGSAITTYTASSNTGGFTGTSASSPVTVTGLTNGTAYTFTVTATNSFGTGPASSASNPATPYTVPSAPTIGTVVATGSTTANVPVTAPAPSNGGNTITSYTAVSSPGNIRSSLNQAGPGNVQVTGLLSGTNYTFIVFATNAGGDSANSSTSNQITTTASGPPTVEYLVVAGGGGGGGWDNGGGGGGGGTLNSTLAVAGGTSYPVAIGGGGAGRGGPVQGDAGVQGGNSVFASITAIGGGGGGSDTGQGSGGNAGGQNGGCGGGTWYASSVRGIGIYPGSTYISGPRQGYDGGISPGNGSTFPFSGAGGGGAGGQGVNGAGQAGAGGIGLQSAITGTSLYYAGGGGGGSNSSAPPGGQGGGGNGGGRSPNDTNGQPGGTNLGGGGGGNNSNVSRNGGNGGSGVVIVAYPSNYLALSSIDPGLTYDAANVLSYRSGYRVYKFTNGSGPIAWPA